MAAAHLLRFGDEGHVAPGYRDRGSIRWLLFWPPAPVWPDSPAAADALAAACLAQLDRWCVSQQDADARCPARASTASPSSGRT